jgi:hypothetical protein
MYGRGWEAEPQDALIAKGTSHEGCSIGKKPKVRAYGADPPTGKHQRRWPRWAERSAPPWEDLAVEWDGGQRHQLGGFSRTALGDPPDVPLAA